MFSLNFKLEQKIVLFLFILPLFIGCKTSYNIQEKIGATRFINNFDFDASYYRMQTTVHGVSSLTRANTSFDSDFKYQGKMSLKWEYQFGVNTDLNEPEMIRLHKTWGNFRTDLSFYPLGISFWIHSSGSDNQLDVVLLQQNDSYTLKNDQLYTFTYSDKTVLREEGWQQIIIPYEKFMPTTRESATKLNLSRVNGYRFEIKNISGNANGGIVHIDALEQLTSYMPEIAKPARFTSMFVQLHPTHHENYDWNNLFNEYLEVGIDTVIIQYAARGSRDVENPNFFYNTSAITWKDKEYSIIENMFSSAEETGMGLILGLHGGRYPQKKGDVAAYDELYNKNIEIIDELYDKFSDSKAMSGWYICEEFHDGASNGWWNEEHREILSNYHQRVAAYAKSKPKKYIVTIAPALWRGRPVDMTYHFFKTFFEQTPDIDILYLQDCGGRCSVDDGDFDVILPHWYAAIKQACDETGVQFGVDIESFKRCSNENIKWHAKEWDNLKDQLIYASLFTKNITQFSWASFRPGIGAFDDYKEYLKKHGLLRSQQRPTTE